MFGLWSQRVCLEGGRCRLREMTSRCEAGAVLPPLYAEFVRESGLSAMKQVLHQGGMLDRLRFSG